MLESGPFSRGGASRGGPTLTVLSARIVARVGSAINLSKDMADVSYRCGCQGWSTEGCVRHSLSRVRNLSQQVFELFNRCWFGQVSIETGLSCLHDVIRLSVS
jgi:hypothetical protein